VREIFPSSNAIFGYIKMNSLGATIFETRKEIMTLWIQTGIYFLTASITYGYQVNFSAHLRGELASHPFKEVREKIATELQVRSGIVTDYLNFNLKIKQK
jgi:hypothetical protein